MNRQPEVSIIIPTYNESKNLPRLLRSINNQTGVTSQTIVVDQDSEDNTQQLALTAGAEVLSRPRPPFYSPPSQSRNMGAKHASADILLHLDADMELPDERFLRRFLALFNEQCEAVIVHETDVAEGWWSRVKAAERECYWNTGLECARGVTRRLFAAVGGYNEAISSGEDMHIQRMYSQLTTVAWSDGVWLRHITGRVPLSRLLIKKYNYGKTAKAFLDESRQFDGRNAATSWTKQALMAYATHPAVALQNPLVFACILPLRAAELAAVRLGMYNAVRHNRS